MLSLTAYISLFRVVENVDSVSAKQALLVDIAEAMSDDSKATQDNIHDASVDDFFYNNLLKSGL